MKIPKKINILGTEYKIITEEIVSQEDYAGLCDPCNKIIHLAKRLFNEDLESKFNKDFIFKHEVIHGFLDESGYMELSGNEDLVNLIAIQFDNLAKIFGYSKE